MLTCAQERRRLQYQLSMERQQLLAVNSTAAVSAVRPSCVWCLHHALAGCVQSATATMLTLQTQLEECAAEASRLEVPFPSPRCCSTVP